MIPAMLVALSLGAAPACGLPPLAAERPWPIGESLTYDLDLLGIVKGGTLQLAVERPISAGKIIPLRARARTSPALSNVKHFAGAGVSWVDAATLRPERYRDEADEGGIHKTSDTKLLPAAPQIVIEYRYGERAGKAAYPREREVLDAVSTLYYLRGARLTPGDRFCFDLVANRRFWRLEGSVAPKKEKVETAAGRFDTWRIDAKARRADLPDEKPRSVHVWIGADQRRLPVAIVSEVDAGPVSATLTAIRGAR